MSVTSLSDTYPPSAGHAVRGRFQGAGRLFLTTILAVLVMHILHEAGHALTAKMLGHDMLVRVNSVTIVDGAARTLWDRILVDAAGPLVTIILAVVAWRAAERGRWALAPTILFIALAMRLLAAGVSLGNPNDEARISLALGLGTWTVFAVVIVLLAAMFVRVYRRRALGWRWLLVSYLAASLAFAALVFGEPLLPAVAF